MSTNSENATPSKWRWLVLATCFLLYMFGNYSSYAMGLTMVPVREAMGLDTAAGGMLSSVLMFGAVIGCVLAGRLASTWGSRNVIVASGVVIGICCIVCSQLTNYTAWIVVRFINGLAYGAQLGPVVTLATDHWAGKRQNMATAFILSSFPVSGALAAFVTGLFPDNYAMVWLLCGLAIIPALLTLLVPSDRLTAGQVAAKADEGESVGFGSIFAGNLKFVTIFAIIVSFMNMAGVWALGTWLPSWLQIERGLSTEIMANFSMVNYLGGFIGYFFWSWLGKKITNPKSLIVGYFATAATAIIYFLMPGTDLLFYWGPVVYFCQAVNVMCSITFAAAFPRLIRAYGAGTCFNVGRVGSIISPYTTAIIGTAFGLTAGLATVPVFYAIGGLFGFGLNRFVKKQERIDAAEEAGK
ncbi:MAG TPA: MFS transporter [Candidatus Aphodovivens excrementavium]|nr:MFS transporter [Candidatus Aphodovivens avistercoris]HIT46121.1 MFS transporter [Candidatus Aphodovivens excrementavium]